MDDASTFLQQLHRLYARHANPQDAAPMRRYMKDQFAFFGIKSPLRQALSRQFLTEAGLPQGEILQEVCRLCFQAPEREMQYFVNDVLQRALRRLDVSFLSLIDELIGVKSWWDTVDFLSPKLGGALFRQFPEQISVFTRRWVHSDNFWYQRAAILFQLGYKARTDSTLLFEYIGLHAGSPEFFVQKGAGWALREYSKTNPEAVVRFITQQELAPLTRREGLKWLRDQGRLTETGQLRK